MGYSIWYFALPKLKSSQAAVVQLTVLYLPIAGMVFLDEQITTRLIIASALILGAVLVFLMAKKQSLDLGSLIFNT